VVHLDDANIRRPPGLAICERIEARTEEHVLSDSSLNRGPELIFDEAAAQNGRGTRKLHEGLPKWIAGPEGLGRGSAEEMDGDGIFQHLGIPIEDLVRRT
jgi:hypothetical protein